MQEHGMKDFFSFMLGRISVYPVKPAVFQTGDAFSKLNRQTDTKNMRLILFCFPLFEENIAEALQPSNDQEDPCFCVTLFSVDPPSQTLLSPGEAQLIDSFLLLLLLVLGLPAALMKWLRNC